jgi:hypothetical protein
VETALSERPITGTGLNTYRNVYLPYRSDRDFTAGVHAHKDFLHLWVETGLIGVTIVMIFVGAVFHSFFKRRPEDAMGLSILFFCAGMAMVTPIILLPPLMLLIALALIPLLARHNDHQKQSINFIRQILALVAIMGVLLSGLNGVVTHNAQKIRMSLNVDSFDRMLIYVDRLDQASLYLHPSAPIYRVSLLLALMEQGLVKSAQRQEAIEEMQSYVDDAKRRNPYNPEILFYQGMVDEKRGDKVKAVQLWKRALTIDPSYLAVRIKLMQHYKNNQGKLLQLIEEGLPIRYWKQDPMQFYSVGLVFAREINDADLHQRITNLMQRQMRLR